MRLGRLWRVFHVIGWTLLADTTKQTSAKKANEFLNPISCVNEGFDVDAYLKAQQRFVTPSTPGVGTLAGKRTFSGVRTERMSGWRHRWSRIGTGQSCLDATPPDTPSAAAARATNGTTPGWTREGTEAAYDPTGCAPFSDMTRRFQALASCLPSPQHGYKLNLVGKPYTVRDLIDRIVKLSHRARDVQERWWRKPALFRSLANFTAMERARLHACPQHHFPQRDAMKCWTVLMGQPGVIKSTAFQTLIQDHQWVRTLPSDEAACRVPAACGRLTLQHLFNFQTASYDKSRLYVRPLDRSVT